MGVLLSGSTLSRVKLQNVSYWSNFKLSLNWNPSLQISSFLDLDWTLRGKPYSIVPFPLSPQMCYTSYWLSSSILLLTALATLRSSYSGNISPPDDYAPSNDGRWPQTTGGKLAKMLVSEIHWLHDIRDIECIIECFVYHKSFLSKAVYVCSSPPFLIACFQDESALS